jgi:hypothetical protein
MFFSFFFFYNNKFVKIFQTTTGYLSFIFFKQIFLLMQAKDFSYSFFFLLIKTLLLFFNRLLLAFSKDVFRLFIRQPIVGYLLSIILRIAIG